MQRNGHQRLSSGTALDPYSFTSNSWKLYERDTILNISDLHNSFYNNFNGQSKPHMKLTWIQKHQIRKLNQLD